MITDKLLLTEDEKSALIKDANEMLCGVYRFTGIWDMEPCAEAVENKPLRWDVTYHGDNEWTYMFTRMDFLYKLILAYEFTGRKEYLLHGLDIIDRWYCSNRKYLIRKVGRIISDLTKKNHLAHRPLDTAIMASNRIDYILYCADRGVISQDRLNRYKKQTYQIILNVFAHSADKDKLLSNWVIIENCHILYCLDRLDITEPADQVRKRLIDQLNDQINANGSQIESSPMYLVQILLSLLRVLGLKRYAEDDDLRLPAVLGCNYIMSIRTQRNCIPNLGDSDLTDISDLMAIAAKVLGDERYKQCIKRKVDTEFCIKYDLTDFVPNGDTACGEELVYHRDQTVYRCEKKGTYLLCSNVPKIVNGHKHYDYLSVIYSEFGKDVLVDLGRFTYKSSDERMMLLGVQAHNVVTVQGNRYFEVLWRWRSRQKIECRENRSVSGDGYFSVKMTCDFGYSEINIVRIVTYVKDTGLFITDIMHGKDDSFVTFFNLGTDFSAIENDGHITLESGGDKLFYHNDASAVPQIVSVPYSPRYNQKTETVQLKLLTDRKRVTHRFLFKETDVQIVYGDNELTYILPDRTISVVI